MALCGNWKNEPSNADERNPMKISGSRPMFKTESVQCVGYLPATRQTAELALGLVNPPLNKKLGKTIQPMENS